MQSQSLRIFDIVLLLLNPSVLMGVFFCLLAVTFEPPGSSRIISALIAVVFTTIGIWFLRLLCFTLIFVQFPPSDIPYNLYNMYLPTLSASLFVVVLTLVCTLNPVWRQRR
jgi:hypothetical protein